MDRKKNEIILLVKSFKKKISKKTKIDKMILFGSQATGKAKKNSDIDLVIVSKDFEKKKYFERSPELYNLWDNDTDIDLICITPAEFSVKSKQIGLIRQALKEGIII